MNSFAASAWQSQVFKRISDKLRLQNKGQEEILLLKEKADRLRDFRKKFLREKFD